MLSLIIIGSSAYTALASDQEAVAEEFQRPAHEAHEQLKEMFTNADYDAWAEFMTDKPQWEGYVNEDAFAVLVEAHGLMEDGDIEGARELIMESELPHKKPGKKMRHHKRTEAMKSIFDNADYDAWVELMSEKDVPLEVNEETFALFVEAHELMQSGDRDAARELLEASGIERPMKGPRGNR